MRTRIWAILEQYLYAFVIALAVVAMTILGFVWWGQREDLVQAQRDLHTHQVQLAKTQKALDKEGEERRKDRDAQVLRLRAGLIIVCTRQFSAIQKILDLSARNSRSGLSPQEVRKRLAPYYRITSPAQCRDIPLPEVES